MIRVGRRSIQISSADKPMFPRAGLTKLDLARYYADVGAAMVPHVRDRPVAMHSFPDGVEGPGYYIKATPKHFPDWIPRAEMRKRGGTVSHVLANEPATLVYLANQNCVTPHVWLSRADRPDQPDRVIFDLDPPAERGFAEVRAAARDLGGLLRDLGYATYAMVTGSKGVHVVVPIRRRHEYPAVYRWAKSVGERLVEHSPRRLTLEFLKENRERRIYVDVRRNAYAQHAVAPYAARPRARAPVAMPIHWDELGDRRLDPERWTIESAPRRLESDGDAWHGIARHARALRLD